jgi:hypothetical protein
MTNKTIFAVLVALALVSVSAFEFKTYAHEAHQTPWVLQKGPESFANLEVALLKMENRRAMLGLKGIRGASSTGVDTSVEGVLGMILGFAYGL